MDLASAFVLLVFLLMISEQYIDKEGKFEKRNIESAKTEKTAEKDACSSKKSLKASIKSMVHVAKLKYKYNEKH